MCATIAIKRKGIDIFWCHWKWWWHQWNMILIDHDDTWPNICHQQTTSISYIKHRHAQSTIQRRTWMSTWQRAWVDCWCIAWRPLAPAPWCPPLGQARCPPPPPWQFWGVLPCTDIKLIDYLDFASTDTRWYFSLIPSQVWEWHFTGVWCIKLQFNAIFSLVGAWSSCHATIHETKQILYWVMECSS